jgi:protein O-GlcNAc transferase
MASPVPDPDTMAPDSLFQQALALHQQGRLAEAERIYAQVVRRQPDHADAWHLLGVVSVQNGHLEQGAALIGKAIELHEPSAAAHNNRGIPLRKLGRLPEALASFDRAIGLEPDHTEAHNNRGITLLEMGRLEPALASFDRAIALRPDYAEAHNNRGILLRKIGRFEQALASYDNAIALYPDYAEAHCNRGNALLQLARPDLALLSYDRAIASHPNHAEAHNGRGNALLLLERPEDALASYDRAIAPRPDHAAAHGGRGNALTKLRRPGEALASYDRAIAIDPSDPGPYFSRAELLHGEGRTDDAIASLEAGLAADPLHGACRLTACLDQLPILYRSSTEIAIRRRRYIAALEQLDIAARDRSVAGSLAREIGAPPFWLPYQGENDVEAQRTYGRIVSRVLAETYPPVPRPPPSKRIRLGIVSGFFNGHTVFRLFLEGWLTELDRDRFEIIGFHTGRISDGATARAGRMCDRFVSGLASKAAWRQAISDAAPHILLYPEVGMDAVVGWLAAQRLAPVQCVTWGHPETTGMPAMDYFLSSDLMEPPDGDAHYTERLVRLPNLGLHYTPEAVPAETEPGLDQAAPVFFSGQSLFKYSPRYDWVFPRIAKAVGDCRFVFVSTLTRALTEMFRERIGTAFAASGLDAERYCTILPKLPHERYVTVSGTADVTLDPPGWSGGRSTLDCLAQNPAIVTWPGPFMRGRHTAAILRRIGCEETIAGSLEEYVSIAARLATDGGWRARVKQAVAAGKCLAFRDLDYVRALEVFLADAVARS